MYKQAAIFADKVIVQPVGNEYVGEADLPVMWVVFQVSKKNLTIEYV